MSSFAEKISAAYTKAGFGERAYQERLAQHQHHQVAPGQWVRGPRTPLTATQHILHLLLTVFTAGLWAPVWIVRAAQGNRPWVWQPSQVSGPSPDPTVPSDLATS